MVKGDCFDWGLGFQVVFYFIEEFGGLFFLMLGLQFFVGANLRKYFTI